MHTTTMEEERQKDIRVPLISGLFFVSCLTGGILLICWLLDVTGSQPWFPILALILIGFPWIFWLVTYIYTFIKACCRSGGDNGSGRSHPKRGNPAKSLATTTNNTNLTSPMDSPVNSPDGKRQVRFGAVVVMDGEGQNGHHDVAGESSNASRESEIALTLSVSS